MIVREMWSLWLTLSIDAIKVQVVIILDFSRFYSQVWEENFQKFMNADLFLFKNKRMFPLS